MTTKYLKYGLPMLSLCVGAAAGCSSKSTSSTPANVTAMRVAHLAPGAADVRLCLYTASGVRGPIPSDGNGTPYGSVSSYTSEQISAATAYTAKVFPSTITTCPAVGDASNVVAQMDIGNQDLVDKGKYTLNVFPPASTGAPTLKLNRDDDTVANTKVKVRITHALTNGGGAIPTVTLCYNDSLLGDNSTPIEAGIVFGQTSTYSEQGGPGAATANAFLVNSTDAQGCAGAKIVETHGLGGAGLPVSALINIWAIGDLAAAADANKANTFVSVDSFE